MTKSERREVAATLREWAAFCDCSALCPWWAGPCNDIKNPPMAALAAAAQWCEDGTSAPTRAHIGQQAALALCFAAAMVESGDSV